MTYRLRIQCVHREAGRDLYEQITHAGGAGSARWKLSVGEVIRLIRDGEREFFVERPIGDEIVIIAVSPSGKKYLMTLADFDTPNALLHLRLAGWASEVPRLMEQLFVSGVLQTTSLEDRR